MTEPRGRMTRSARRAVIEDAAARRFGAHGFTGARLEDIAADAGVTKQLLYRHFADKTELYLVLLRRHAADLPTFAAQLDAEAPLADLIRAVLDGWLDYSQSHGHAWRMLFRDTGGGPAVQAVRDEVHARARAILVQVLRAHGDGLPEAELEPLAELLSMGMAALVLWWADRPQTPRDGVLDAIVRVWTGVLASR